MKKLFVLLALIFLVSGCTIHDLQDADTKLIIDEVMTSDIDLKNQSFRGYQYYLPREVELLDKNGYNSILLYNNKKMYLYVDLLAYYNHVDEKYQLAKDIYLYKEINVDDKKGYVRIIEKDNVYYIEMRYNYSRIQAYTEKKNINPTIVNMAYILKTMTYNDTIIESMIGDNKIEYQEYSFDLFKSESKDDHYLNSGSNPKEDNKDDTIFDDDDQIELDNSINE